MSNIEDSKDYNIRILIVDDNKAIHEDFRKVLLPQETALSNEIDSLENDLFGDEGSEPTNNTNSTFNYELDSAYQGQEAIDMATKAKADGNPYSLIFMDVRMPPGMDGIETIGHIWEIDPYAEIVICTAYSDYSWDEIIEKLGQTDKLLFLKKPFDSVAVKQMALTLVKKWNLDSQARNYVLNLEHEVDSRTQQLNKLLKQLEKKNKLLTDTNERLAHIAVHDALTDIPNRVLFNDRLTHAVLMAHREKYSFSVCMMDLNKFKEINDNDGHLVGDQVLKEVAKRMDSSFRDSDTVARLGGDEFALLLPKVTNNDIPIVAKKIIDAISQPMIINDKEYNVGISIGFSLYPDHGDDNSTLINCADFAMYKCKRNSYKYAIYNESEDNNRFQQLQLTKDLDLAIKDGGLQLFYQPIVDVKSHRIQGVEALCRWIHPEVGSISPEQFIRLAEENNMIMPLTDWVIETAVNQCAKWNSAGHDLTISINISVQNLLDSELPGKLEKCLTSSGLPADHIKIEITESMTMVNPEHAMRMLRQFSKMGVRISIDDFGTGYSSLSYLAELPVNELKIDRCFVMEMKSGSSNDVIVKSTIDLAHNLGIKVVAEGIEHDETLNMLSQYGCDFGQGFHICKPIPVAELERWLNESTWGKSD